MDSAAGGRLLVVLLLLVLVASSSGSVAGTPDGAALPRSLEGAAVAPTAERVPLPAPGRPVVDPPRTWGGFTWPVGALPPSDPQSGAVERSGGPRPSIPQAEARRLVDPLVAQREGTPVVYRPSGGPTDLNLSGTTFLLINSDTTVRNITIRGNATLEVNNPSVHVTLTVLGNIAMSGNSLLFLNKSSMVEPETYDFEQGMTMTNDATFVTLYANETSNGWQWGLSLSGSANLTVLGTNFSFPGSWTVTEFNDHASGFFAFSLYLSDLLFLELPPGSSQAHLHTVVALGFNVWLSVAGGESANLTLPGSDGWRNWSFPGGLPVSGVGYTIGLYYSYVSVFSLMVWQGSNVSLHDSPDALISLEVLDSSLSVDDLEEGHTWHLGIYRSGFALSLRNVSVYTWNLYPFGGALSVDRSQVGEIQVYDNATAVVRNSTLDGRGGYYGNQGSGPFTIFNSSVSAQVVGYSGWTQLENCSFNNTSPADVLALGTATIELVNTGPTPLRSFQAEDQASILEAWSVHVNVSSEGPPVVSPQETAVWSSNSTVASAGPPGSILTQWRLGASGRTYLENYSLRTWGSNGGNLSALDLQKETWLTVGLTPLVRSTDPANGSTGLPVDQNLTLRFAFPMSTIATLAAVSVVPQVPFTSSWDIAGRNLSLAFADTWPFDTIVTTTVGTGAVTTSGLPFTSDWSFEFQILPAASSPPRPQVSSSTPTDGATAVWTSATVELNFTQPMAVSPTKAAFSIAPSVAGTLFVGGHTLTFSPTPSFAPDTSYEVELTTGASDTNGTELGSMFELTFTTGTTTTPPPTGNSSTPPSKAAGASPWYSNPNIIAGAVAVGVLAVAAYLVLGRRPQRRPKEEVAVGGSVGAASDLPAPSSEGETSEGPSTESPSSADPGTSSDPKTDA